MALRKISNMEMELNFFKDSIWRLTSRVFVLEDFVKKKFGDVLTCCNSKQPGKTQKGRKRKRPNLKVRIRSPINLRNKTKVKHASTSESEAEPSPSSRIKTEHLSEAYSDEMESESEEDEAPFSPENHFEEQSPQFQGEQSRCSAEDDGDDDMDTYIPIARKPHPFKGKPDLDPKVQVPKPNWTHVKDFVNKEAAEGELSSEWAFKYTLTDADGTKTTYDCKHEIGTCPAKVRLVSLNNIESVSYFTNNVDHVHSEDAKYGFNFSTKKVIDALMAEGVTEPEPMMKALLVRNILVEQKYVNRYLGGYKKQLGLFNKSPTAKRLSYTACFKLEVCAKAEKVGNKEAAREYNIDESNVRNWRKCKSVLEKLEPQRSSLRGKGAKWPSLEKELAQWIADRKAAEDKITTELIRQEAAKIAQRLNLLDFSSSKGWLERFTKRLGESFARRKAKKKVKEEPVKMEHMTMPTLTLVSSMGVPTTSQLPMHTTITPPIDTDNNPASGNTIITQNNNQTPITTVIPITPNSPDSPTTVSIAPPPVPITTTTTTELTGTSFPINSWYVEYVQQN